MLTARVASGLGGPHDPRQGQDVDAGRPRPLERLGAGLHRRARGQHVVHQQHAPSTQALGGAGCGLEGAGHVAPSRRR